MRAKFVIGRAGAGKTSYCVNEIAEDIDGGWSKPILLLVPNQISLEMEKSLVSITNGRGMDIAEVLSFERLSYRIFSLYGKPAGKILDDMGKSALIRKILYNSKDRLKYFTGSHAKEGFANKVSSIITEFYKYGIDAERLAAMADGSEDFAALSLKIEDLSLILDEYAAFIKEKYISSEQNLDLLADLLPDADFYKGARIWIDGFFRFSAQDYRVIRQLASICDTITFSLTMPETTAISEHVSMYDPFFETKTTAIRIFSLLNDIGAEKVEFVRLKKLAEYGYSAELTYLEQKYFHYLPEKYERESRNVFITPFGSIYDEINYAAAQIVSLVRDENFRYKEIAVVTCNLSGYEHVIRSSFCKYGIPFFMDEKKTIYFKRLVEMIRSLVDVGVTNYSVESVIRLLRTELFDFSSEEIDILENYLLEYGISGYKWGSARFEQGKKNRRYNNEKINNLKLRFRKITDPFLHMFKKENPTVLDASCAIFKLIDTYNMKEKLAKAEKTEKEAVKTWNIVVSVFDKIVEILGEDTVDIKMFSQILEGAFSGANEGFIPATVDSVIVGDIVRTRLSEKKILLVLGLTDDVIPSPKSDDGLLTDADRQALGERGMELGPSGVRSAVEEQFMVYNMLTKPKERLYLSFPAMGLDDSVLRKSIIIDKLIGMFPDAKRINAESAELTFSSEKSVASDLAHKLNDCKNKKPMEEMWLSVFAWFKRNRKQEFEKILDTAYKSRYAKKLSEKTVKRFISREMRQSVTKIERFINCPFSYFAEYELKAESRTVYEIRALDFGNIYHYVLDNIGKEAEKLGISWDELVARGSETIIDDSVKAACNEMDILSSSEKNKYLVNRIKRVAQRAVYTLVYQLGEGEFEPHEYEVGFGLSDGSVPPIEIELADGYKFAFAGRIDRVDIYKKDGDTFVKIIDYKSGRRKFDFAEVYYGLQLQLLLYLEAYLKGKDNTYPAGAFYFKVSDPIVDYPKASAGKDRDEQIIDEILNKLQLSGLVVNDYDIINAMHSNLEGKSNIIPVAFKKRKEGEAPEPYASSDIATMEQFYDLMKRVNDIIKEAGNRLVNGDIEARPVKWKGGTACTYCKVRPLCGFDIDNGYRYKNLHTMKKDEVFEAIKEKK